MASLRKRPLFNPEGDIDVTQRRLIGGNTTNMNDFNNLKYTWTSDWYRQAMNNFWIPEEINLGQDVKDYRQLPEAERRLRQDPLVPRLPRLRAEREPAERLGLHHGQRGRPLPDDPVIPGVRALAELQLHARHDREPRRAPGDHLPVEG